MIRDSYLTFSAKSVERHGLRADFSSYDSQWLLGLKCFILVTADSFTERGMIQQWIYQTHWCFAHSTNTHILTKHIRCKRRMSSISCGSQRRGLVHPRINCFPYVTIQQVCGCEQNVDVGIFMCARRLHRSRSLELHLLWTMRYKNPPHNLMVNLFSHACMSWGPWHQKLIKTEPRLDPSSSVTDRAPNHSYSPAQPPHK